MTRIYFKCYNIGVRFLIFNPVWRPSRRKKVVVAIRMDIREHRWRLEGFNTFAGEAYSFPDSYRTEAEAVAAGRKKLKEIKKIQSDEEGGIQDQVWVIRPDGRGYPL